MEKKKYGKKLAFLNSSLVEFHFVFLAAMLIAIKWYIFQSNYTENMACHSKKLSEKTFLNSIHAFFGFISIHNPQESLLFQNRKSKPTFIRFGFLLYINIGLGVTNDNTFTHLYRLLFFFRSILPYIV